MTYPIFGRGPAPPRLAFERPKKRDRELGTKWAATSRAFLRKHPFCAEHRRRGMDVLAALVDHIVPRRHGGSMWERSNLQPLCRLCHDGVKRNLERLAVERGDVQILSTWVAEPHTRPAGYAYVAVEVD